MATKKVARFVRPDLATLTICNGEETLTVKRRLSAGEQRGIFAHMFTAGIDGATRVNPLEVGMAMVTAYLLDWTFTDDEGRRVAIEGLSPAALTRVLDNLYPDVFTEIVDAIRAHDAAMTKEREVERASPFGSSSAKATSPSPSAPDGKLIGSVN